MFSGVPAHIAWNALLNLEVRRSYKALHDDLVLPSTLILSNTCHSDNAPTMDAIRKELPSRKKEVEVWTYGHQ